MEERYITLYDNGSKFINTYGEDAKIISSLFGYKLLDNSRCGFPNNALDKVISILKDNKVSIRIEYKDHDEIIERFGIDNKYYELLERSKINTNVNKIKNVLIGKINSLDEEKLKIVVDFFDKI